MNKFNTVAYVYQSGANYALSTPYNASFIAGIKSLGGRWDGTVWTVPATKWIETYRLLNRTFDDVVDCFPKF